MPGVPRVPHVVRCAALIAIVAFAVRLVHVSQLRPSPFFNILMGDSRAYDEWARRLAAGDWIGSEVFYQAPLYPYFLGVIYALFGRDLFIVRTVQAVIGSMGCVLLGLAGARLFSRRVGLTAGLLLALYPPAIFLDGLIQKSTLDVLLICVVLWLVSGLVDVGSSDAPRDARRRRWFALGAALGALSLTRENALVLMAVALVWAATAEPGRTSASSIWRPPRALLACLLGLLLALAPVVARNLAVGGGFYITTSQLGPNFYIGNNARANGTYMALREGRGDAAFERQDAIELAEQARGRQLSPAEVSSFWRDRALQFITSDPVAWLRLTWRKVVLLLNDTEMIDTEAQESHAEWSLPLGLGSPVGRFGVLLPLAVVGLIVTWEERARLRIVYALTAAYAVSVVIFFVVARYRYPLVPFLILFAAAGLHGIAGLLRASASQRLVAATLVIIAAAVAQAPTWSVAEMRATTETNLGAALQRERRFDEAVVHYRRAIAIRPEYAPAHNNLGVALRDGGRLDDAIAAYRQALARQPDYAEIHYNLAMSLVERGHEAGAVEHFVRAQGSVPATIAFHSNFGTALTAAGRHAEAIREFRAAVALDRGSISALRNLANALARDRQYDEAIPHFQRVAELDRTNPARFYDLGNVLMEAKRLPEAEDAFRVTIRLAPGSAQAHSNLGVALAAQGKLDEAIGEFERALTLQPDFATARRYLEMGRRNQVRQVR